MLPRKAVKELPGDGFAAEHEKAAGGKSADTYRLGTEQGETVHN